jgi:carbonic anhydrase/acetyltransferase-like protein (isoleucine patch superfamily)
VLNNAVIADDCLIGAGALVTEGKSFPAGSLIIGSPARAVKELSPEVVAGLKASAAGYATRQAHFATALERLPD